jgi:hypothetical protein
MEAIRAQREEERSQADSALYQVSILELYILMMFACPVSSPLTFPFLRTGLRRGFLKSVATALLPVRRLTCS